MGHSLRPIVILAWVLGAGSVATAQSNAVESDVPLLLTRIELDLRLDYGRGSLAGRATLTVRNRSDRLVRTIPLLLNRLMTVMSVTGPAGEAIPFEQSVRLFRDDSSRQVAVILVTPPEPLAPHDTLRIIAQYGGILVGYTETGSLYIKDHVSPEFTIIREDAYAFPMLGVPSWRANRAMVREPFAFAARVTVPAAGGLVVAAGGAPGDRETQDSTVTWTYHSTAPVPFLNITVAPYRVLERTDARIFYFAADSDGARMVARAITDALDRYARWFGPLDQVSQLVVMEIPEGFGSQASLSAGILQTADAFHDRAALPQVYHELSHLWNVADLGGPSPRWNEGLASYLQWRMAAELDGWSDWDGRLRRSLQSLQQRCGPPLPCDSVPFTAFGTAGLTDRAYPLGLLMFFTLHQVLGPERFDRAYRDFYQRFRATGARPGDLIAAFHRVSDKSDAVFRDWFETTRWYRRIAAGESVRQMIAEYR